MMSYILFLFFNMFRICCLFMIPTTHWTDVLRDFSPTILSSLSCAATDDLETNILWIAFGSLFPKCRTLCLLTLKLICHFFTQKYRLGTLLPALHWLRISPFQKKKSVFLPFIKFTGAMWWALMYLRKLILVPLWGLSVYISSTSSMRSFFFFFFF